jgi:L-alanine-DL-glutamate epimerase-like enolase superfamily enzyme
MKITAIETIQSKTFPNCIWLHVHTDEGLVGLGETTFGADAVAAFVHESVAPYLLGSDPLEIDRHNKHLMMSYCGFSSHGTEMRAASAVDIALWDIFGQVTDQPIYQLLGGASRDRILAYNTCAGYRYFRNRPNRKRSDAWGIEPSADAPPGPYEDLVAFQERAGELAQDLLSEGYTAMKIWPFDQFAFASGGNHVTLDELKRGLRPFEQIREAVGDRMDIMLEMHSLWSLPPALRIAAAVEPLKPFWYEDPIRMNNFDALAEFASRTSIPVTASETLATRWVFRDLMAKHAARYIMFDIGWVGGISEAKKIASMAEAHHLPVAPHDCTGPVVWTAACQLTMNLTNAAFQECVRAYFTGWFREIVTELPTVKDGYVTSTKGAGLGTRLSPQFLARDDLTVRRS